MITKLPFVIFWSRIIVLALLTLVVPGAAATTVAVDWNTFVGSSSTDFSGDDIVVDANGNVYVTGTSDATWGDPVNAYAGNEEVFVAKFDSSGNLSWNTFLGSSSGNDYGKSIAVDSGGNVYVTGRSASTWGSPVNPHAGGILDDAFVAKLDSNGNLDWNTFMGSLNSDFSRSIAVDDNGYVYVTGHSVATWGSPINNHAGGGSNGDAFVAKLDDNGNLSWNTFMGSLSDDVGSGLIVDANDNVYVTGHSQATWGTPVEPYVGGSTDAFVAQLSSSGNLNWNTFVGSSSSDTGHDIATSDSGTIYVVGGSTASWGNPVAPYTDGYDVFVAELNSGGNLNWNTFMGSSGPDHGYGITVSNSGTVYVTGNSRFTWGNPINSHSDVSSDIFIAQLSGNDGNLAWNTFMGSLNEDSGYGITAVDNSTIYVVGQSSATWGTPVDAYAGSGDVFVAKLSIQDPSYLQFSLSTYQATENSGQAVIKVTRTGNTDGAVSVDYASSDDTAVVDSDYTAVAGTLNWEDGESDEKSFIVNLVDDSEVEDDENIILTLGNVTGEAVLGTPDTATLVIVDDDQGDDQSESECKHAIYLLEDQMLAIPAVEVPVLSVIDQQPTGEKTLLTGILKQHPTEPTQFSILFFSEVFPETIAAASSCPATYSLTSGVLSVPWVDIPVVGQLGSEQSKVEAEVFKIVMQWQADLEHFVVEEIQRVE